MITAGLVLVSLPDPKSSRTREMRSSYGARCSRNGAFIRLIRGKPEAFYRWLENAQ